MIQKQEWATRTLYLIVAAHCSSAQLSIYREPQGPPRVKCVFHNLWVGEEERRKGIGKMLLDTAERLALEEGEAAIWLDYDWRDTPEWVRDWYIRQGYGQVAFGRDGELLKKELRNPEND